MNKSGSLLAAGLLAAAGCAVGLPEVHASTTAVLTYNLITESGETGGWTSAIWALDPPTINESGDVAFRGRTDFPNTHPVLWVGDLSGSSFSVSKVIEQGDSVPGYYPNIIFAGDTFVNEFAAGISQPLLRDDGQVAFVAGIEDNGLGGPYYPSGGGFFPGGVAKQIVFKGQPSSIDNWIVGSPDYFRDSTDLQPYYFNLGGSPFRNRTELALPKTGHDAVGWYMKVVNPGTPAVHTGGVFWTTNERDPADLDLNLVGGLDLPIPPDIDESYDDIAVEDESIGAATIYHDEDDTENIFSAVSLASPASEHIYGTFSVRDEYWTAGPSGNNSHLIAVVEDHPTNGESKYLVAQSDVTTAPGVTGSPKLHNLEFAPDINNDGDVVFRAQTDASDKWGVWKGVESSGSYSLSKVAYDGDSVPGVSGSTFNRFGDPVINGVDDVVFLGRYTQSSAQRTGVFRKSGSTSVATVARQGTTTPTVPNAPTRSLGTFDASWGDPSVNGTGNVAFLADVSLTDTVLKGQYQNATQLTVGPAIFATDYFSTVRCIVSVGMKVEDLIGGEDNRVIIDLQFLSEDVSTIDDDLTLEGNGSGHQDGRRVGMTNQIVDSENEDCHNIKIAFWAQMKEGATVTEANFVAELSACDSGCTTCLCSTDPDCMMMGMTLNDGPDFNGDSVVDSTDIGLTVMAIGVKESSRFDLNEDGIVDAADVAIVYAAYETQAYGEKKE